MTSSYCDTSAYVTLDSQLREVVDMRNELELALNREKIERARLLMLIRRIHRCLRHSDVITSSLKQDIRQTVEMNIDL